MSRQKTKQRFDILDDMTKEEIIHFVRQRVPWGFRLPSERDVLMYRWETQQKQLQQEEQEAHARFSKIDFAERDRIAVQFNAEQDLDKKMALFEKLTVYQKAFDTYMSECQAFGKRNKALTNLFNKAQRCES